MQISKDLKDDMISLRLSGILPTIDDRISYAKSKKLSYEEFLEMILFDEWERRQARLLNTKMRKAGVEADFESYSWDTTTAYDRGVVGKLFNIAFVENHSSIFVFGPTGVGKTFLAKHLAFCALKASYSVIFTRADKFFKHLRLSAIDGTYERTISSYIRPDILVIDGLCKALHKPSQISRSTFDSWPKNLDSSSPFLASASLLTKADVLKNLVFRPFLQTSSPNAIERCVLPEPTFPYITIFVAISRNFRFFK
jgi:hypothetical protein